MTIPKHSETALCVSVSKQNENDTVLLEPLSSPSLILENLVIAKCLVTVRHGKAILRILNPTGTDIKLRAHKIIAKVSSVDTKQVFSLDDPTISFPHNEDNISSAPKQFSDLSFDLENSCLTPA